MIEEQEHNDALAICLDSALALIKEQNGIDYIVVNNDDGTCYKVGINEEIGLWISKYTDDDIEVQ